MLTAGFFFSNQPYPTWSYQSEKGLIFETSECTELSLYTTYEFNFSSLRKGIVASYIILLQTEVQPLILRNGLKVL